MNIINSKWVFKRKLGPNGEVCSYKARLVAQGFLQKAGVDYDETFSPVVRFESVRTILALASKHGLHVHHMDVDSTFLNGELEEDLFMYQPVGINQFDKKGLICKLNKSLYGLKQAPKCWNSSLDSYLKDLNFEQSKTDSCVYTKLIDNVPCFVAIYVDDIIIACKSVKHIIEIKNALRSKYNMKDLGELSYFLGVKVTQNDGKIFINQAAYTNMLLTKFNFDNCKPVSTPADLSSNLEKAADDSDLFDVEKYQSAVGGLLYLSSRTRPDITYAVCNVAKYCSKPTNKHWTAVKRIFRYLKGTVNLGILYTHCSSDVIGYSDADWAGDKSDRRSTSGYCYVLGRGVVSWRSNKQTCVALSTAEAEYVALSGAAQEGVWLNQLLKDLKYNVQNPVVIYEDNQAAMFLANNPKTHPKTKHIDIKFHFIRDLVSSNKIVLKYCPTNDMLADIFTKPVTPEKFSKLRENLGMCTFK